MKNLMVMGMMLAMVATGCKAKEPLEAQETLKLFKEIYGKAHGGAVSGPLSHIKP